MEKAESDRLTEDSRKRDLAVAAMDYSRVRYAGFSELDEEIRDLEAALKISKCETEVECRYHREAQALLAQKLKIRNDGGRAILDIGKDMFPTPGAP